MRKPKLSRAQEFAIECLRDRGGYLTEEGLHLGSRLGLLSHSKATVRALYKQGLLVQKAVGCCFIYLLATPLDALLPAVNDRVSALKEDR